MTKRMKNNKSIKILIGLGFVAVAGFAVWDARQNRTRISKLEAESARLRADSRSSNWRKLVFIIVGAIITCVCKIIVGLF